MEFLKVWKSILVVFRVRDEDIVSGFTERLGFEERSATS